MLTSGGWSENVAEELCEYSVMEKFDLSHNTRLFFATSKSQMVYGQ